MLDQNTSKYINNTNFIQFSVVLRHIPCFDAVALAAGKASVLGKNQLVEVYSWMRFWDAWHNLAKLRTMRTQSLLNKYVGPPYCWAENVYADRVACCLLLSHGEYADGIDGQADGRTPDRYFTLSAIDAASLTERESTSTLTTLRPQKSATIFLPLTLPNIDRFSQFFQRQT